MGSINGLVGNNSVSYSSLSSLADGTYNKGEIVFKKGFFGGFEKVNNHVGLLSGRNTVVTTAEQNRVTNAAVFKAILTRFCGQNETAPVFGMSKMEIANEIMNMDLVADRESIVEKLDKFVNPYIKEAFNFLLGGDRGPLTRDEMHMLDALLQKGESEQIARGSAQIDKDLAALENLRKVKLGESGNFDQAKDWIKGLKVANALESIRVRDVSINQITAQIAEQIKKSGNVDVALSAKKMVLDHAGLSSAVMKNVCGAPVDHDIENVDDLIPLQKSLVKGLAKTLKKAFDPSGSVSKDALITGTASVALDAYFKMHPMQLKYSGAGSRPEFRESLQKGIEDELSQQLEELEAKKEGRLSNDEEVRRWDDEDSASADLGTVLRKRIFGPPVLRVESEHDSLDDVSMISEDEQISDEWGEG